MKERAVKSVIIGLAAMVVGAVIWFAVQGEDSGTVSENDQAETIGPAAGGVLAEVIVPETLSAAAETGQVYYEAVCSACHGANGAGQDGVAPPLVHKIYEPSHHSDAAFQLAPRNGVRSHHWSFGNMPPLEERLTDGEIGAIITYIRELQRANGIY